MFLESLKSLTVTNRNCWVIGSFLAYLIEILVLAKLYHRTLVLSSSVPPEGGVP